MSGNNFVCRIEVIEKEEVAAQVVEKEVEKVTVAAREKMSLKKKTGVIKRTRKRTIWLKVPNRPTEFNSWFEQFR